MDMLLVVIINPNDACGEFFGHRVAMDKDFAVIYRYNRSTNSWNNHHINTTCYAGYFSGISKLNRLENCGTILEPIEICTVVCCI